jgi:hypothetical protein
MVNTAVQNKHNWSKTMEAAESLNTAEMKPHRVQRKRMRGWKMPAKCHPDRAIKRTDYASLTMKKSATGRIPSHVLQRRTPRAGGIFKTNNDTSTRTGRGD